MKSTLIELASSQWGSVGGTGPVTKGAELLEGASDVDSSWGLIVESVLSHTMTQLRLNLGFPPPP